MNTKNLLRTRYQWLAELSSRSGTIANLNIANAVSDDVYRADGQNTAANADAFNLSNSAEHNEAVINTIDELKTTGASESTLKKFIIDLTSQNTYGTFSELSAYRFLQIGKHKFDIQVRMDGSQVLNANGSDLDGIVRLPEEIYFDIKGFGFLDHLVNRLTKRLSNDLAPKLAVAEDSWDVPAELLNDLLGKQYGPLLKELQNKNEAIRDSIKFSVRTQQQIQITEREINPEELARQNAEYAFRFCKQFVRNKPFFLVFVLHPWFSGSLHVNFDSSLDIFTTEFSKQIFCHFESDNQKIFGLSRAAIARLLSGIVVIDAWEGKSQSEPPLYRLFLNPNATNKPKANSIQTFAAPYGSNIIVKEIKCP